MAQKILGEDMSDRDALIDIVTDLKRKVDYYFRRAENLELEACVIRNMANELRKDFDKYKSVLKGNEKGQEKSSSSM